MISARVLINETFSYVTLLIYESMKVKIVGTGYVGLVTGACPTELGNDVLCFDIYTTKIELLNNGFEPDLADVIARTRNAGRLRFSTNVADSVAHGVVQFIAVGTLPDEDGSADVQYVLEAARNIGQHRTAFKVIVDKSTLPAGTADKVRQTVAAELSTQYIDVIPFAVVSNPEFCKEGAAVEGFMWPGGIDPERAEGVPQLGFRTGEGRPERHAGFRSAQSVRPARDDGGRMDVLDDWPRHRAHCRVKTMLHTANAARGVFLRTAQKAASAC
ncbi:hypothetical protein BN2476_620021 [Paraburkholderia piptadeniae]|uniref:UDP-glucose 6-dehydrogenase n=1 Tax=Paraburkholderia piptadeniae TaxID=1701573 RepID=A0A1N7SKT9_9BURK|nr:hypothetical protein BN2476_620021 [Paraburkholderia piptadeniae]